MTTHRPLYLVSLSVVILALVAQCGMAQSSGTAQKRSGRKAAKKSSLSVHTGAVPGFHPTCTLDSGSVGSYFFPANLGAKWTMRRIFQAFDGHNTLVKVDTSFSYERVVSDSERTLQGLPVLLCESSMPYHVGGEASAKTQQTEYYVDDSVIIAIFNHSMTSELNHNLLVNPLVIGNHWREADTIQSTIIATKEPVTVPMGSYSNALVVRTALDNAELSKYFVPGVGIVKSEFRGVPREATGTIVVTSELVALDPGDSTRSIKYRFQQQSEAPQ